MFSGRDLLSIGDLNKNEIQSILDLATKLKSEARTNALKPSLIGKVVGLVFEKPSTRTRASFETAIFQLGGAPLYLRADELQLTRGEPIKDTARILGDYLNGLVIRTYAHKNIVEFAEYAPVPIINALSDLEHPTQIVGDMLTVVEKKGRLAGLKFVWVGDGNNVCNSWLLGGATMGMNIIVSCPKGFEPNEGVLKKAEQLCKGAGGTIAIIHDPRKAVLEADVLYTDVWVSMGQEKSAKKKEMAFKPYQLNKKLLSIAKSDCAVMHCLPAHRGMEITDEVLEGANSIVWQQADNKLHSARAVLAAFVGT
ncbi:MAG TPA: ornithine carbamoyltransferase [Candidatus Saccharimonadales bacterium]|nr:ornithine carbamoyltransferase [Candidatus Saccharimonadales bacterium]